MACKSVRGQTILVCSGHEWSGHSEVEPLVWYQAIPKLWLLVTLLSSVFICDTNFHSASSHVFVLIEKNVMVFTFFWFCQVLDCLNLLRYLLMRGKYISLVCFASSKNCSVGGYCSVINWPRSSISEQTLKSRLFKCQK
jgi:hypothetical protein